MAKLTLKRKKKGTEGLPTDTILWDDINSDIDDTWADAMLQKYPELVIEVGDGKETSQIED